MQSLAAFSVRALDLVVVVLIFSMLG